MQIFHYYSTPALLAVALLLGVLASLIVLIARKRRELKVPDNRQVIVGSLGLAGGLFTLGMFIGERTGSISGNTLITLEVAVAVAAVTFANVKPWEPPVPGAISWPCERWHPNGAGAQFCSTCGEAVIPPSAGTAPMVQADDRDRPRVGMLWLWWFVFAPVVWFLAPSYARRARRLGFRETARYWTVFWLSVLPYAALGVLIVVAFTMFSGAGHTTAAYSGGSSGGYPGRLTATYTQSPTVAAPAPTSTVARAPTSSVAPAPTSTVARAPTTGYQPAPTTGQQDPAPGQHLTQDPSDLVDSTKWIVQDSEPIADSTIGSWILQLGAFEDPMGAMKRFTNVQLEGLSNVIMVWSADYTSFKYSNNYVVMVPQTFATAAEANSWCDSQGFASGDCFAKRLSHTDGPQGNNVDR